jgi:NADH:ubiquinone oxidoreductase subunit 5 (subunit L)/multisubunit Na+/H+ antiporter MnhA subunit
MRITFKLLLLFILAGISFGIFSYIFYNNWNSSNKENGERMVGVFTVTCLGLILLFLLIGVFISAFSQEEESEGGGSTEGAAHSGINQKFGLLSLVLLVAASIFLVMIFYSLQRDLESKCEEEKWEDCGKLESAHVTILLVALGLMEILLIWQTGSRYRAVNELGTAQVMAIDDLEDINERQNIYEYVEEESEDKDEPSPRVFPSLGFFTVE